MKRFFLGFAIGIVTVFVGLALLVAVATFASGNRAPRVANNSVLVFHLEGEVPERTPLDIPIPFLQQQQPMTVAETWNMLRRAATDSRIKALVLEPRGVDAGWAKLEELRGDILAFKKSGKPVYAFLRTAGTREYYLASAADRVFISPEDELDVKGLRAELMFVKGTLDKLGVNLEFEHVGKYKDAPDMFTKTASSPETREVINQLLDQFYGDFVTAVADGRHEKPDAIRAAIDNGPFVGKEALDHGLVDELAYEEQVFSKLEMASGKLTKLRAADYARTLGDTLGSPKGAKIAYLAAQGDITRGNTNDRGDSGITVGAMTKMLRDVRNDDSIKGVILRVDSPGGESIASDEILHEAKLLSQKKPTVISMSDLAASGGYYIAMTGDPVVAYPNTETGSIGVFFGKVNLHGLYDKVGVNKEIMKRGHFADIDTDYQPLNDEQRAKLRTEIEGNYHRFVQLVSEGRKRKFDDIEPLAQGRVWTGSQGKQNGLVDELGGIDRAIELVKQRAKIPASDGVALVTYPPRRGVIDLLMERGGDLSSLEALESAVTNARIEAKLQTLAPDFPFHQFLHGALVHGGMLSLLPYQISIR